MNKGIYLLLGSNMGDAFAHLNKAIEALKKLPIEVIKISSVYKTAAWGKTDQNPFLNQCLEIKTELNPQDLLNKILQTELELGRTRLEKWAERIIDIDGIIDIDDRTINGFNREMIDSYDNFYENKRLKI